MKTSFTARFTAGIVGSTLLIAALLPVARAGEPLHVEAISVAGNSSMIDPITGDVSVGYDSHYVFRGQIQGEDSPWAGIDVNVPIHEYDLDLGVWLINNTDPRVGSLMPNDELNLSASLGRNLGPLDITVDYIAYLFPEIDQQERSELGLRLETSVRMLDFGFAYYHDFELDSNYFEWWVGTWIEITDRIALHLDATLGHFQDNFSNVLLTATLAVQLTENMWLEPFVSGSIDGDDIVAPNREDQFFGGAGLRVLF